MMKTIPVDDDILNHFDSVSTGLVVTLKGKRVMSIFVAVFVPCMHKR